VIRPARGTIAAALCIVALMLIGGFFRMQRLGAMGFWMDEAFSVQTARAILQTGAPRLENGETILSWLPAHYAMAGALGVFPEMHAAARLPSAVSGTWLIALTAALAFLLARSRLAAVLAAFFVAFSVPDLAWSRQARGYVLLQFFGVAALILVLWGPSRRSLWRWAGASALLALAILTHRAGYMYWLMCAGVFALDVVLGRPRLPEQAGPSGRAKWAIAALLLAPLLAGFALPAGTSQGLSEAVAAMDILQNKPSYSAQYFSLIFDFWRGNTIWMVAGMGVLLMKEWRKAVPVAVAVAAYLFILSEKTLWFHVRYLMPILPVLHVAVAAGMGWAFGRLWAWRGKPAVKIASLAALGILCLATTSTQNLTFVPNAEIELGPTEPQADWRGAFEWLRAQEAAPATVMALPVFHDLYLGPGVGTKYFLPFTFTRVPGEWQESAPYAVAEPVRTAAEVKATRGYVVLDEFSFYSLRNPEVQDWLAARPPVHATPDGSVQIWRVP
jgi:hypothetical protein